MLRNVWNNSYGDKMIDEKNGAKFVEAVNMVIHRKGLKHSNLAKSININEYSLNNYLSGRRKMPLEIAIRLMLELHIDMNSLFQTDGRYALDEREYRMMASFRELPSEKQKQAAAIILQLLQGMK